MTITSSGSAQRGKIARSDSEFIPFAALLARNPLTLDPLPPFVYSL